MTRIALAAIGIFLLAPQSAEAAATWTNIGFTTTAASAPKILKATDALMSSATGKQFPGRLLLMQNVADGDNPATHVFVPIYASGAEREAFGQKLQADPAWGTFTDAMAANSQPGGTVMYRTLKSWGNVEDADTVWMTHAFNASDPAGFMKALEAFRASKTGQAFEGQVHVSGVVAGGLSPVSHVISVGYASEAEMEAWADQRNASPDWAAYIAASRPTAEYLGGTLARTLKAWGPASLKSLTTP
jgi:hypothetical protein